MPSCTFLGLSSLVGVFAASLSTTVASALSSLAVVKSKSVSVGKLISAASSSSVSGSGSIHGNSWAGGGGGGGMIGGSKAGIATAGNGAAI